jgi:hypothetical protein
MITPLQPKPTTLAFPIANVGARVPTHDFGTIFAEFGPLVDAENTSSAEPELKEPEDLPKEGVPGPGSPDWVAVPATSPPMMAADVQVDPAGKTALSPQDRPELSLGLPQISVTAPAGSDLSLDAPQTGAPLPEGGNQAGSVPMLPRVMAYSSTSSVLSFAMLETVSPEHQLQEPDNQNAQIVAPSPTPPHPAVDPVPEPTSLLRSVPSLSPTTDLAEPLLDKAIDSFAANDLHPQEQIRDTALVRQNVSNIAEMADGLLGKTVPQQTVPVVGFAMAILAKSSATTLAEPAQLQTPELGLAERAAKPSNSLANDGAELANLPQLRTVDLPYHSVTNMAETDLSLSSSSTIPAAPIMVESNLGQGLATASDATASRGHVAQAPLSSEVLRLIQSIPDGPVVLTLSPRDLGTLQFEVTQSDRGLHIQLAVDNPETFDLLRRQADEVLADLRQAGFSGASLSFTWGSAQDSSAAWSHSPAQPDTPPEQAQPDQKPQPALAQGTLDLRL